uniref:DNA-directed DNA polymerase family A palm domain-containing protein n=1 Tax=Fundulus heteroclitus TaxID=8078 RepID=A0A3Q2PBQ3_FUNHE
MMKIRVQTSISGCPTSSEEQQAQVKITPCDTRTLFKTHAESYVLKQTQPTSQSTGGKSSNEMARIAPKQKALAKLCKHKLAKLMIDPSIDGPKGSHDVVTTSELQTQPRTGPKPAALTSDARIKDSGRLSPEERVQMLEEAGQAEVVVLTMTFQDGTTQLDPEQSLVPIINITFIGTLSSSSPGLSAHRRETSGSMKSFYIRHKHPKSMPMIVYRRDVLLRVLSRSQLVVCYKAKDFLRTVLLYYRQDLSWKEVAGCQIHDPQVSGWLLDPTDPSSCFHDLLNKHCKRPSAAPSPGPDKVSKMSFRSFVCENSRLLNVNAANKARRKFGDYKKTRLLTSEGQSKRVTTSDLCTALHNLRVICFEVVTEMCAFVTDFCQVELRLLAHFSSDPELLRIFTNPQADVFAMLASQWKVMSVDDVTPEDREHAKRIVYSLVYGAGRERLSGILGVSPEQASRFQDTFLQTYREVQAFIQRTVQQSHRQGYVLSLMGRRRNLPHINSPDWAIRMQAERQAVNFVVQGRISDCFITGQSLVHSGPTVTQLHDELLYEVEDSQVDPNAVLSPCVSQVPLKVAVSIGKSWGSMSELHTPPSVS